MGGYNSGNHGGRPTVEASLALNLPKLLRDGLARPNCTRHGSLIWSNTDTSEQTASIRYETHLGDTYGRMRLLYTSTDYWTGEKRAQDYWIHLVVHPGSHAALGGRAIPGERRGRCRRRLPQTKGWRCAFQ